MKSILFIFLSSFLFIQCKTTIKMAKQNMSEAIQLQANEENAVFLAVNHVDILRIKGMEFYHFFLIILTRNPNELSPRFSERAESFYLIESREATENEVIYYDSFVWRKNPIWETTISASSECGYDTTKKKLGNLIKAPNYDRTDNFKSGKRVFAKKIASNDLVSIEKLLEFENRYDNSLKYALLPEINKQGYNSNSFCRGALEYAGLLDKLTVPACYKSPGVTKSVVLN